MGFARRVVRKSVRRATPRPVRQAMHSARTVKNAVTPRPVKQVSRAVYTTRHPIGAAENRLIDAALYPPRPSHRRKRGFWSWLTGRSQSQPTRKPERPAPVPAMQPYIDPSGTVGRPNWRQYATPEAWERVRRRVAARETRQPGHARRK